MKIVMVHHGEPNLEAVRRQGFAGMGLELAPLTEKGERQSMVAAMDARLGGASLILSSPYTRAMQTASILAQRTGLPICVEPALHEFLPDKTFQSGSVEEREALHEDFMRCKGVYPAGEARKWESLAEMISRVRGVLDRYLAYDKVIWVVHSGILPRFTGKAAADFGEIQIVEYSKSFEIHGWI